MAGLFKKLKEKRKRKEEEAGVDKAAPQKKIDDRKKAQPKPKVKAKPTEKEKPKKKAEKKKLKKKDSEAYRFLLKPLITEKATDLSAQNQYVFVVPKFANKIQIAQKIEHVYGVSPIKVRIINFSGKNVRYGRYSGKRKDWKKAVVYLRPEDKLEIYEGV